MIEDAPPIGAHDVTVTPSSRIRFSIAITCTRADACSVFEALCEPKITSGRPSSGLSGGGGSSSITSRAAPASVPDVERGDERVGGDDGAAAGVDEVGARLHLGERAVVEEVERLGGERAVDRDEVAGGEQVGERDDGDAERRGRVGRRLRRRVGAAHDHPGRRGPDGDGAADAAEPDDAERRAAQRRARPASATSRRARRGR